MITDKIIGGDIGANMEVSLGLTEEQIVSERNRELLVFKIVLSECEHDLSYESASSKTRNHA